jgi:hypothetical protein
VAGRAGCYCGKCPLCRGRIKSANQRARKRGDFEAIQIVPPPANDPPPPPLVRLAPGPFISHGGFLNYRHWPEGNRFLELDRRINKGPLPQSRPIIRARNLRIIAALDQGVPSAAIARQEGVSYELVRKVKQHRERFRAQ